MLVQVGLLDAADVLEKASARLDGCAAGGLTGDACAAMGVLLDVGCLQMRAGDAGWLRDAGSACAAAVQVARGCCSMD